MCCLVTRTEGSLSPFGYRRIDRRACIRMLARDRDGLYRRGYGHRTHSALWSVALGGRAQGRRVVTRRRETAEVLAIQLFELEVERRDLQSHLYRMVGSGSAWAMDVRRGLDRAAELSSRIDHLRQEVRRADERSLPIEEELTA